jgi:hypothetical protein
LSIGRALIETRSPGTFARQRALLRQRGAALRQRNAFSWIRSDDVGARGERRDRTAPDKDCSRRFDAGLEINLMVQEKFDAAAEALTTLVGGGSVEAVLSGYRRRVTLNARRLSLERKTR